MTLNACQIMGRLTAAPELRRTQSGKAVVSFTIAVDRFAPDESGRTADFIDCVAWNGTAEFISQNFCKGQMMLIQGRLQVRTWTDAENRNRKTTEIVCNSVYFCGANPSGTEHAPSSGYSAPDPSQTPPQFAQLDDDGTLPF